MYSRKKFNSPTNDFWEKKKNNKNVLWSIAQNASQCLIPSTGCFKLHTAPLRLFIQLSKHASFALYPHTVWTLMLSVHRMSDFTQCSTVSGYWSTFPNDTGTLLKQFMTSSITILCVYAVTVPTPLKGRSWYTWHSTLQSQQYYSANLIARTFKWDSNECRQINEDTNHTMRGMSFSYMLNGNHTPQLQHGNLTV